MFSHRLHSELHRQRVSMTLSLCLYLSVSLYVCVSRCPCMFVSLSVPVRLYFSVSLYVCVFLCPCTFVSLCVRVRLCPSVSLYVPPTFTATSHKVLVESSKARVYCVVALRQAVELAHQTLVHDVPQMNALQTHSSTDTHQLHAYHRCARAKSN